MDATALAERASLELHRAVADRLLADPAQVERARRRAEAWAEALSRPLVELTRLLEDPGERACQLRQTSPLAGVLDARTRWAIWRRTRRPAGGP